MTALLEIGLSNLAVATALALIIASVSRLIRSPALVHGLWLLVLVKLLTPPVIPVQIPVSLPRAWSDIVFIPASTESRQKAQPSLEPNLYQHTGRGAAFAESALARFPVEDAVPVGAVSERDLQAAPQSEGALWHNVLIGLIAVWGAGTTAYFAAAAVRTLRFRKLVRMTLSPPAILQDELDRLAARMGMPRGPRMALVPGPVSPMLWSIGGEAKLLFPIDLLKRLSPEARETLLLHELAHMWRRDHWVRIIEFLATGLYWWNPVVWWARREIYIAEEDCCDAWVLWEWPGGRKTYATALLETIEFLSEARPALPLAASGIGRVEFLQRRLRRIMQGTASRGLSASGRSAIAALAVVLLPTFPQAETVLAEARPALATVTAGTMRPAEILVRARNLKSQTTSDEARASLQMLVPQSQTSPRRALILEAAAQDRHTVPRQHEGQPVWLWRIDDGAAVPLRTAEGGRRLWLTVSPHHPAETPEDRKP